LSEALDYTLEWYQGEAAGAKARELCLEQIGDYTERVEAHVRGWSCAVADPW
jgi:hypothetical protein